MKKIFFAILMCAIFAALLLVVLSLAACSGNTANELNEYTVQLYYANDEYIDSGNESLKRLMPPVEQIIESNEENVYLDTILYLKIEPDDSKYVTLISPDLIINDVIAENGLATVDLDGKGLNGGALQEMFLIEQITHTLLYSFDEITEGVLFTVDGEIVDSLMGHITASEPFKLEGN